MCYTILYIGANKPIYKKMNENAYCNPTLEDFPTDLYVGDFKFQLSSDCCSAGIYRGSTEVICLNCTEPCKVIEDLILE